jgi:hypothetical protein
MKYLLIILFFSFSIVAKSQTISSSGSWTFSRGATDVLDAGLNLTSTASSGLAGETIISFSDLDRNDRFRVDIRKVDTNWDSRLLLTATKFADGTPSPTSRIMTVSPIGSAASQLVTNTNASFFTLTVPSNCNNCRYNNVRIRYAIDGISVEIPAATYTTQVQYTIINL